MKSRVHPKYKTKYHISNWAEYDRALVRRGDITLWISEDPIESWKPAPSGGRGGQRKFSDLAIETALTLRLLFSLPASGVDANAQPNSITLPPTNKHHIRMASASCRLDPGDQNGRIPVRLGPSV